MNNRELLIQGLKDIIPDNSIIIPLLERYIQEIETFNSAYGLVGTTDTKELIIKHILDSLAPLGILFNLLSSLRKLNNSVPPCETPVLFKIADVGSGAGLPGIPLAIAKPNYDFTLIERMGRRVGFLLNTIAVLGLPNVTVEESEVEKINPGRFDLVTFRAFKPLEPKLLKALFKILTPGGLITAYKGKYEKIIEEMKPLEKLCGSWEVIPYTVPFLNEDRHLLVIRQ